MGNRLLAEGADLSEVGTQWDCVRLAAGDEEGWPRVTPGSLFWVPEYPGESGPDKKLD